MHPLIQVYGSLTYRDPKTPLEDTECQTFVNQLNKKYGKGTLLFAHIKNEGKRTKAKMDFDNSMGFLTGISDYVFFGNPMLCIEMKRKDHTKSVWQPEQEPFLLRAQEQGCKVCVALGWESAMEAVEDWIKIKA